MFDVEVEVLNPIFSRITKGADKVSFALSYSVTTWRQGQFKKESKVGKRCLIKARGQIYTGWLPLIKQFCDNKKLTYREIHTEEFLMHEESGVPSTLTPVLPEVGHFKSLRPEQEELIRCALTQRRGFIVAPMATGKTVIIMGIIKAYEGHNVLILCHGTSLLNQTYTELEKFGFRACKIGEGEKEITAKIVVATMQTMRTLCKELIDFFDVVIIDESHVAMRHMSTYELILGSLLAPVRLGFTATPPQNLERKLISEGLLGPIIGEITFSDAEELGIMTIPIIEFLCPPALDKIKDLRMYKDIYREGVVENKLRNRMIIAKAKELTNCGKSVLIFSSEKSLEHGEILLEMAEKAGIEAVFLSGKTPNDERIYWQSKLEKKELKCAIVTRIWREGINIRTLDAIILAKGGKGSEESGGWESLLQTIGRCLRVSEDKDYAIIVDILDPYKYLASHCIERLQTYVKMGWL